MCRKCGALLAAMTAFGLCFLAGAAQAAAPVAYDQKFTVLSGIENSLRPYYTDSDTSSGFSFELVSGPSHGTVTFSGTMPTSSYMRYTPGADYTGTDSWTWRVNDGSSNSNTVTCSVLVRNPGSTGNRTVLIAVKNSIQSEIQSELDQLKADVIADGYPAEIVTFSGSTAQDLWNALKTQYNQPGRFVAGAILVGQLPFATCTSTSERTDFVYMNLDEYRTTTNCNFHMWVSRMWALDVTGSELYYGDEVKLLKRTLTANHEYRTGVSGLPYYATFCDTAYSLDYTHNLTDVWPQGDYMIPRNVFPRGGDFMEEQSHGERECYDDIHVSSWKIHDLLAQVRWAVCCSCKSGYPGGVVNNHIFTRRGGNVMAVGATETTYSGWVITMDDGAADAAFRGLMTAGDTFGDALIVHQPFTDVYRLVFYGDLSMRAMHGVSNQMPAADTLTASATGGVEPLTVDLSANGSDSDGTLTLYEWFPEGHQHGRIHPAATGRTSLRHIYDKPHRYLARVQVVDNKNAVGYKEVEIRVGPQPGRPVRINCGAQLHWKFASHDWYKMGLDYRDSTGKLWLHDQRHADGTWGWTSVGVGGEWSGDITGTIDDTLFHTYRKDYNDATIAYEVPVSNGTYTINVGFADKSCAAGERLIDVTLEGSPWLTAFDIVAAGGQGAAVIQTTSVSVTDGTLDLVFATNASSTESAIVSCIEIIPQGNDNKRPEAVINANPTSGPPPLTVNFTSTGSYDPDGTIVSYEWDFGDGATGSGASISHEYTLGGIYSAILKVTDDDGVCDCDYVKITAGTSGNTAPVASDQNVDVLYNTPKDITLSASDADGDGLTYIKLTDPQHGTLSGTLPNLTYTPHTDYFGSDSFTWKANDGTDDSNVATVYITVLDPGSTETLTLYAEKDTFLDYNEPAIGHDEDDYGLWIDSYLSQYNEEGRTLIQFDVSGVPSMATVQSATLRLHCFRETGGGAAGDTIEVVRCESAWDETTACYDSDANNGSEVYGHTPVPVMPDAGGNFVVPPQVIEIDVTSLVQEWVDGTHTNHGMRLWGNDTAFDTRYVDSEDTPGKGAQYVPTLTVTYGGGGGPSDTTPPTVSVDHARLSGTVSDDTSCPLTVDVGGTPVTVSVTGLSGTWQSGDIALPSASNDIPISAADGSSNSTSVLLSINK